MDEKYAKFLLDKTRKDYNLIAQDFSRTRENPWPELEFLFKDYPMSGEKVLDLGCGNGRYVKLFQEKQVNYFGVDASSELIEIAKKKNPGVNFQLADAFSLPFADNYFDKIYSIALLHHIPSEKLRSEFLKEAKRVLKKDGLLVLTVWKFHRSKELFLILKYNILKLIGRSKLDWNDIFEPWGKKAARYYHSFSRGELFGLMKKPGFKIEKIGLVQNRRGNRRNIYLIARK